MSDTLDAPNTLSDQPAAEVNDNNQDRGTRILDAVRRGDQERVEKLIEDGAHVNGYDEHGKNALDYAILQDNENLVEKLIDGGADVNTANNIGETALFQAVMKQNEQIVQKLIDSGADVNATSADGNTALIYAMWIKNESLAKKLIDCGSDVNVKDEDGYTVFSYALLNGKETLLEKLIDCGAEVNGTDGDGNTPLTYAVWEDNENIVEKLLDKGADVKTANKIGKTPLFYAICKENKTLVQKLTAYGADINAIDEDDNTLLSSAVRNGNNKLVEILIDSGADVNATNAVGNTALTYAIRENSEKLVKKLLHSGADVNISNEVGQTPLFHAVKKENEKMVQIIIDSGADVNASDVLGRTALFDAVDKKSPKLVQKLIDCGCRLNAHNKYGNTVLTYAISKKNKTMVEELLKSGADVNTANKVGHTPLFYAVNKQHTKMVQKLIDSGAHVNATNADGNTALTYAVWKDNEKLVEKLIGSGADVNASNKIGETALFHAVNRENENMVVRLIAHGVDVNATNADGNTALTYAILKYNEKLVENLISSGADVNAQVDVRDRYGRTPLYYAMTHSLSFAKYLLDKGARLHVTDNCSVLTYFIERCFFSSPENTPNLRGLDLLEEWKDLERNTILKAIVSVVFCKTLCLKPGSCDIDVDSLDKLMTLAKKYLASKSIVHHISNLIHHKEREGRKLIESGVPLEIYRRIIQLGANPDTTDSDGNTALHHATQLALHGVSQTSVMGICQKLQQLNVSLNITNHHNETPLLHGLARTIKVTGEEEAWSAVKTQANVCTFLVEYGSSVEGTTVAGETVLHLTMRLLQQCFLKRIEDNILDVVLHLVQVSVDASIRQGIPIHTQDKDGNTPLHLWAKLELPTGEDYSSNVTTEGNTLQGIMKTILDHFGKTKALLHVKNKDGETPLHLCRTWNAVELLLEAGANPYDLDSCGRTPLLVAATNNKSLHDKRSLYPDNLLAPDKFWRTARKKGLDPWTVDVHNNSLFDVLMESESHDLAKALVYAARNDVKARSRPLILFSLLTAICRDISPDAQWKKDAADMILNSTRCPVNGNAKEDSPLHFCCRNIVELSKCLSTGEIKTTVHWRMVELLRSFGADYRIPDAADKSCLDIAEKFPELKDLLMKSIDLDRFPVLIKPWKLAVSKTHERCLARVARHLESEHVESYWYHKDPLASGSFGDVFAGINEKDGREVAIKRILKRGIKLPEGKREVSSLIGLADCEQIVLYLHVFEDKLFSYIVLELLEGNLDQFLTSTAIQMETKVSLCQDVVKGLQFLHEHNTIHRDLKPTNILYKTHPKLRLKIADFGLSRRIDITDYSTSVYGNNAGTRCWIAPEVLTSRKPHSKASDVFACGLVLHYVLSVKTHAFSPRIRALQHEIEANILKGNMEGWDDSVCPEAAHLLRAMLDGDDSKRPSADEALDHPFFWSKQKTVDFLIAVGNENEFECPRASRIPPLTAVETDLEASFSTILKHTNWNDRRYIQMPAIYTEMTKGKKRKRYDTRSVVELVRFIRNAHVHVKGLPKPMQKLLQEVFLFLEYFPNLVMEVYKAVTTHGWDQTRKEIQNQMKK